MSREQPRYAVYYAPPAQSALWQLGQSWLGRDCESGEALAQPSLDGWSAAEIAAVSMSPRHYGFHATLKAPFRLAPRVSPAQLREAVADFAAQQPAFTVPAMKLAAIGRFIAITLASPSPAMQALADAAVEELDAFRASLTKAEIARRLEGGLTARQEALLRRWGYPYVFEEFHFHMTLTGRIEAAGRREHLQSRLAALFRPALAEAVPVREVCLYSQADRDQPFRLTERFPLGTRAQGQAAQQQAAEGQATA